MKRPLCRASLVFITGILIPMAERSEAEVAVTLCVCLAAIGMNRFRHDKHYYRLILIYVIGAFIGHCFLNYEAAERNALLRAPQTTAMVTALHNGSFEAAPVRTSGAVRMWFGKPKVLVYESGELPRIGQYIEIGNVKEFRKPTNDGEWDTRSYYRSCGIYGTAERYVTLEQHKACVIPNLIVRIRNGLIQRIRELFPGESAGMVCGLLLGDKTELDDSVYEDFRELGLAHILAVSGMHVTLLGGILMALLLKIIRKPYAAAITAGFLLGYGMLTGFPVSCIRAVFTVVLTAFAGIWKKTPDRITGIMLLMSIMILNRPTIVLQSGFVLSFYCAILLTGLTLWTKQEKKIQDEAKKETGEDKQGAKRKGRILSSAASAIRTSLVLQTGMLPVQVLFFQTISPIGFLMNTLLLSGISVIFGASLLAIAVSYVSMPVGRTAALFPQGLLQSMMYLVKKIRRIPGSVLVTGHPGIVNGLLFLFAIGIIIGLRVRKSGYCYMIMAVLWLCFVPIRNSDTMIYNLDIGQGDCAVIIKKNTCIVLDCGSTDRSRVGSRVLKPFLRYHGFAEPDLLIVSHRDADHTNGLAEFWDGEWADVPILLPECEKNSDWKKHPGKASNADIRYLAEGDSWKMTVGNGTELKFRVLWPLRYSGDDRTGNESGQPTESGFGKMKETDTNAQGLVLLLSENGKQAIFTADIGAEQMKYLTEQQDEMTDVTYVKVPHHGSYGSCCEPFYRRFRPNIAVCSAGNNSYGHPSDLTLAILRNCCDTVFITKENGQVTTDFTTGEVRVFREP